MKKPPKPKPKPQPQPQPQPAPPGIVAAPARLGPSAPLAAQVQHPAPGTAPWFARVGVVVLACVLAVGCAHVRPDDGARARAAALRALVDVFCAPLPPPPPPPGEQVVRSVLCAAARAAAQLEGTP
jgi:hypothetical protein